MAREIVQFGHEIDVLVLLGARNSEFILAGDKFEKLGLKVAIATEDGSEGHRGVVSDLFAQLIRSETSPPVAVYGCGPVPMLRKLAEISRDQGVLCQVSMEQRMGCGLGACLGCVVKGTTGYLRVCREGPVFDTSKILWDSPHLGINIESKKTKK